MSSVQPLLDAAGRRRSPATTQGFRTGIAPRNKGQRYAADRQKIWTAIAGGAAALPRRPADR